MKWVSADKYALSLGTGLAFSTANPVAVILSISFPAFTLNAKTRRAAFNVAACYYAGASWSIIFAVPNFFGPEAGILEGVLLWITASSLLSVPWLLLWIPDWRQFLWRAPLGLALSVLPPLGIIGWASPLTAAGYLFPGTSWFGLLALMIGAGCLAARLKLPVFMIALLAVAANVSYRGPRNQVAWEGINTRLGGIVHEEATPIKQLDAVEAIQRRALDSSARVVVFPETVVPNWNAATDAFWSGSISKLQKAGKTILVGSRIDGSTSPNQFRAEEFAASIAILRATSSSQQIAPLAHSPFGFRNVLLIRGSETGFIEQRVPVPLGMWRPLDNNGVPLRLAAPGVVSIAGERAAILICYEQLLCWPILRSMLDRPTVIVAVANDHWAMGTTIPEAQLTAVQAWARLNSISYVSATNF
jgi:hypothetical protein